MSFFNTIANFFKSPVTEPRESDRKWREGYIAFRRGQDLYFQNDIKRALSSFDTAITLGFEGADVYGMRGGCLQSLQFDLDAIDDFTEAIESEPDDSNRFFMRSASKGAVGDLKGRVADLKEAIRVAEIDNASSRSHNEWAKENGFENGIVAKYQMELAHANLDLQQQALDERRLQGPGANLGPDLATRRRSQAHGRTRE